MVDGKGGNDPGDLNMASTLPVSEIMAKRGENAVSRTKGPKTEP